MNNVSPTELARLRQGQEETRQDTCIILRYVPARNRYNMPKKASHVDGETLRCGFSPGGKAREVMGTTDVSMTLPTFRLPWDLDLDKRDRIKLTHRFGEELALKPVYEVIGTPNRGPSGLVVTGRIVTDGSDGNFKP